METIEKLVNIAMEAHSRNALKPSKAFRKSPADAPYFAHPVWCAMTLIQEPLLSKETRHRGALALLLHDVEEDTSFSLAGLDIAGIRALLDELKVEKDPARFTVDIEIEHVPSLSDEACLLKLHDKVSNLMYGRQEWMGDKWPKYLRLLESLLERVRNSYGAYGSLLVTTMAAQIIAADPAQRAGR